MRVVLGFRAPQCYSPRESAKESQEHPNQPNDMVPEAPVWLQGHSDRER